jgi:hypothetical protein
VNRAGVTLTLAAVVLTAACSGSSAGSGPVPTSPITGVSSTLVPDLDTYTDRGDGCAQVVSAIGYADEELRPRGQEARQTFDDSVRSRLAAVGGTIALELDDLPTPAVVEQAKVVQPLAEAAGALTDEKDRSAVRARLRTFTRYRAAARRLTLACWQAAGRSAGPTTPAVSPAPVEKLPSSPATEGPTSP